MNKLHTTKRILIIGGMGPQASIHAHKRLQEMLIRKGKNAEIVHISLVVEHFFSSKPALNLTDAQIALLKSIEADTGFIACNTAHLFFDHISKLVNFKLISMLDSDEDQNSIMVCSPTSRKFKVFGNYVQYMDDQLDMDAGDIIELVNTGQESAATKKFTSLISSLPPGRSPLVSCTELSMLAHRLELNLKCTLEKCLRKIVKDI